MTLMIKLLAGGAGFAALAAAAPAAAQYYPYNNGYGYNYNSTQAAASRCTAAVQARLNNRGSGNILGALFGLNTRTSGRVLSVNRVDPNRRSVRVTGYATSGRYAYNRYGYGAWGSPFYSPFYRSRFGWGGRYAWGWNDPFWYGGGVDSYVEYHSDVDLHIRAAGTNAPLFDGRAQARSATNRLDKVIPSLVDAIFTGFPGRSGETVKITIPARQVPRG